MKQKKTTSPFREKSAAEITADALRLLEARGVEAWRQNNHATRGRAFIGRKGIGDISGYVKATGLRVEVEVKKIGDTLKDDQHIFLHELDQAGGIALVATQQDGKTVLLHFNDFKP